GVIQVYSWLSYIILGGVLGGAGQGARVIVGLKKEFDRPGQNSGNWMRWFNFNQLLVSLFIGAVAGILASLAFYGAEPDKKLILALLGAGYSGADFIEGFMSTSGAPAPPATGKRGRG